MLIGKLLLLFVIGFICLGCEPQKYEMLTSEPDDAWWISKEFIPRDTSINGIPVTQIRSDWKYVAVFSDDYFEKNVSEIQFGDIQKSRLEFKVQANLDNTPNYETFIVGIYETLSGRRGRFIAIFRNSEFIKLFSQQGFSGYSSIYLDGDQMRWYKCMECSDFDLVSWSKSDYTLR